MERVQVELDAPGFDRAGTVIRYGHWGRPVLVFPSEQGRAWDYENNGMVDAVRDLIEAGRVKLYCVDSFDAATWSDNWVPLEERAQRHGGVRAWVTGQVVRWIGRGQPRRERTWWSTGCSMGAYHALQLRPRGTRTSSRSRSASPATTTPRSGTRGASAARRRTSRTRPTTCPISAVTTSTGCAVGCTSYSPWARDLGRPTRPSLPEARRMAGLLAERGISHDLDVWGHDAAHDWGWWRRQLALHLPRFC